jgi:glycosyltransferase involved in cell wall biosynthesis
MSIDWSVGPDRPVRSVALLLNNPFQTDSRAWKMARTLGSEGFEVTVVARAANGLPAREDGAGFRVVRVAQPQPFAWLPTPRLPDAELSATAPRSDRGPGGRRLPRRARLPAVARSARRGLQRAEAAARASVGRAAQAARYLRLTHLWARDIAAAVPPVDAWQAEGLVTLPVALELRRRCGGLALYDARDLDVRSARFARLPGPWRGLLERRERSWARGVDALLCASVPYARVLQRSWGRAATIVWNGPPDYDPPDPPRRLWHERLGLAERTPVVLYLGLVMAGRGIEELSEAIGEVPGAALVVAGFGVDYERYRARAATLAHADRIFFVGGVEPQLILDSIAAADISAMPVQGDTLNHRLNTPTKLFDAMGAGVPVVASDLPGMAPIVRETGCGELCDPDDPSDIARAIRVILESPPDRRAAYRDACLAAARGPYAWERQAATLLELYAGLRVTERGR